MTDDPPPRLRPEELDRLRAIAEGTYVPLPKASFDAARDPLFGGIAGLELPVDEFEITPGLAIAKTYAHLMVPLVLAFARPAQPKAHHPGPWASLHGRGLDITTEVRLAEGAEPLRFDRLNTLWFVVALLRLRLAQPLQMVLLADRPLNTVPSDVARANLLPIELDLTHSTMVPKRAAGEVDLQWMKNHLSSADTLMTDPVFNRAFRTLDQAVAISNPGAGIVIAWAAIEALFRPGSQRITDRISRALATHLHPSGSVRDRSFGLIVKSYEARGGAVHAGRTPETKEFQTAFQLARAAFIATIEAGQLPNIDTLLARWQAKT